MTRKLTCIVCNVLASLVLVIWAVGIPVAPAAAQAGGGAGVVRFVVPYAPGGGSDSIGRIVAPRFGEALGSTIVVENRSGASGMVGAQAVVNAAPDGHTILIGSSGESATNSAMMKKMPYDPLRDLIPVIWMTINPVVLVASKNAPYKTLEEVLADAKRRPEGLAYATVGVGSPHHLAGELLRLQTKANLIPVPYRGSGPAMTDVISGQVPLAFLSLPSAMPHLKSGNIRPIAVATAQRVPMAPDIPTIAEQGVPGFEVAQWNVALVPAGTPASVIAKLNAAFATTLADPEVRAKLADQGAIVVGGSPEKAAAFVRAEVEKYTQVAKQAGIELE